MPDVGASLDSSGFGFGIMWPERPGPSQGFSYPSQVPARQGALTAAGVVWVRMQEVSATPVLRQVLTYDEIARLKAEGRRPGTAAGTTS